MCGKEIKVASRKKTIADYERLVDNLSDYLDSAVNFDEDENDNVKEALEEINSFLGRQRTVRHDVILHVRVPAGSTLSNGLEPTDVGSYRVNVLDSQGKNVKENAEVEDVYED